MRTPFSQRPRLNVGRSGRRVCCTPFVCCLGFIALMVFLMTSIRMANLVSSSKSVSGTVHTREGNKLNVTSASRVWDVLWGPSQKTPLDDEEPANQEELLAYFKKRLPERIIVYEELSLRSALPRGPHDITIATQCNVDRMRSLERMAGRWGGIISAAIYLPPREMRNRWGWEIPKLVSNHSTPEILELARAMHARVEALNSTRLDLWFVSEKHTATTSKLYPVNALRNVALRRVESAYVFTLDVDFVPMTDMHQRWTSPEGRAFLRAFLCESVHPRSLIVPIFMQQFEADETPGSKEALREAVRLRKVKPWDQSQQAYGLPKWNLQWLALESKWPPHPLEVGADPSKEVFMFPKGLSRTKGILDGEVPNWPSDFPLKMTDMFDRYEPFLITAYENVPAYDERFRGYGFNKVQHSKHMQMMGIEFWQSPWDFSVHYPHRRSSSRKWLYPEFFQFNQKTAIKRQRNVERLFYVLKEEYEWERKVRLQGKPRQRNLKCRALPE